MSTATTELRRFLTITGQRLANGQSAPEMFSPAVDAAWHKMLGTPQYANLCQETAGQPIGPSGSSEMRTASPSSAILRATLWAAETSAFEGSRSNTSIRVLRMLTVSRPASAFSRAWRKVFRHRRHDCDCHDLLARGRLLGGSAQRMFPIRRILTGASSPTVRRETVRSGNGILITSSPRRGRRHPCGVATAPPGRPTGQAFTRPAGLRGDLHSWAGWLPML
jgi:hypothetical protein